MENVSEANHKAKTLHPNAAENLEPLFDAARHMYCSRTCIYL